MAAPNPPPIPTATNITARDRVFSITELAEKIIFEVPIREVLVNVQRVNHHFKNLVEHSTPLQQALHFQSVVATPLSEPSIARDYYGIPYVAIIAHPLLGMFVWGSATHRLNKEGLSNEAASWRRQLACQPAVKKLRIKDKEVDARDKNVGVTVEDVVLRMRWEERGWWIGHVSDAPRWERPRWQFDVSWEFKGRIQMMQIEVKEYGEKEERAQAQ